MAATTNTTTLTTTPRFISAHTGGYLLVACGAIQGLRDLDAAQLHARERRLRGEAIVLDLPPEAPAIRVYVPVAPYRRVNTTTTTPKTTTAGS